MGARGLALLAVPVLLAGCAELVTPIAHSTRAAPAFVRITVAPRDVHGSVSLHDAIRFIHITGADADIKKELDPFGGLRVRLPAPGEYLLASWSRACRRTCDSLRQPVGRCSTSFVAAIGQVTLVEIRFPIGRDCAISVSD
jgi:hypothetical protein